MKDKQTESTDLLRVRKSAIVAIKKVAKKNGRTLVEEATRAIFRGLETTSGTAKEAGA